MAEIVKKLLAVGIILLLVGVGIPSTGKIMEQSSTILSDGTTLYVGGNGPGNYTKIQKAIDAASDGDTVFVYNETYIENVVVDKSINLIGENRDTTEIFSYGDFHYVVYISDDWVNISGFTIRHYKDEHYFSGIKIGSNGNNITGNKITTSGEAILLLDYSDYNIITENIIVENFCGIYLSYSSNNIINNNNIIYNGHSIIAYDSNNNTIKNNFIFYTAHSIIFQENCINNTITGNHILENRCCTCIGIDHNSNNNTISYNTIDSAWWMGIGLEFSFNNTVVENILSNCGIGVLIWNASDNIITKNTIRNGDEHGILCTTFPLNYGNYLCDKVNCKTHLHNYSNSSEFYSNNNTIYHNNLINNAQNTYDEFNNIWDNGYPSGGNYWDDYNGTDDDGDGIGDISYIIPGNDNEDKYPLMQPVDFELPDPKTVYVNDDFNSTIFGWGYDHFNNIQDGIDAVDENGSVFVYNGTYVENVVVDKSINLVGEDRNTTVIDGNMSENIVNISADWVNITGFTIQNGDNGIDIRSKYNTIHNNNIGLDTEKIALLVRQSNNIIFYNNISGKNGDWSKGVELLSDHTIISDNILIGWHYGIFFAPLVLDEISNTTISGNKISHNHLGIYLFLKVQHSNISGNTISENNDGIIISRGSTNNIISANIFRYNDLAIQLSESRKNNITGNAFNENNCGIAITTLAIFNKINHNNFINNSINARFWLLSLYNKWEGNYWNRPRLLPKPIIGSIGLFIPWINFDWHPAKEPYDIEV